MKAINGMVAIVALMVVLMIAGTQAMVINAVLTYTQTQPHVQEYIIACAMPDGTLQNHIFAFDTLPNTDLCEEIGGVQR